MGEGTNRTMVVIKSNIYRQRRNRISGLCTKAISKSFYQVLKSVEIKLAIPSLLMAPVNLTYKLVNFITFSYAQIVIQFIYVSSYNRNNL